MGTVVVQVATAMASDESEKLIWHLSNWWAWQLVELENGEREIGMQVGGEGGALGGLWGVNESCPECRMAVVEGKEVGELVLGGGNRECGEEGEREPQGEGVGE